MRPWSGWAPCPRCEIFPSQKHGYRCLCHQRPGNPFFDPEYADVDEAGQLSVGVAGEQRAIPGLARARTTTEED